jgi:glycosyltransferase involved in cell wall biosynthesis
MDPRRIAFALIPSSVWMGGFNYLLNLFKCVTRYQREAIHPILFYGLSSSKTDATAFSEIEGVEVVQDRIFDGDGRRVGLRQAITVGVDRKAIACFRRFGIDLLFESATYYGWKCPIPALAWFPDFQHRYMWTLFSPFAWCRREMGFRAQVLSNRTILVSSEDGRHDCESFYPRARGHIQVLPFPALVDPKLMIEDPNSILVKYALPREFAYLPNQFWKHKNHATVIKALGLLQQRGRPLTVVATGNTHDRRYPKHLEGLNMLAKQHGVTGHFRILGSIPREHVIALMRTCSVMINPSYFEGWSTTVEEAKTLGVPMLLSDLKVHREQAEGSAYFFPPDSHTILASLLEAYGGNPPDKARLPIPIMEDRMSDFASRFAEAAISSIERFSTNQK